LADVPASGNESFRRVTVLASAASGSVSLASTPGATTFSVASSFVVAVSATAAGGSLVAVMAIPRVAALLWAAAPSVTRNVIVRVAEGLSLRFV
jgi:hypothetical protein